MSVKTSMISKSRLEVDRVEVDPCRYVDESYYYPFICPVLSVYRYINIVLCPYKPPLSRNLGWRWEGLRWSQADTWTNRSSSFSSLTGDKSYMHAIIVGGKKKGLSDSN